MSNIIQLQQSERIIATRVEESKRLDFFPTLFGGKHGIALWLTVEPGIFTMMEQLSPDYDGAFWEFYTLSNGGCYIAPVSQPRFRMCWSGNYFNEEMSADAAGISACLFTWSYFANMTENKRMTDHYYQLRDYAMTHHEAQLIARLID